MADRTAPRPPIRAVIGLPPEDSVRAFEARDTLRLTTDWTDMWQAEHARQFTVAKVARADLLADIEAAVADVIANGGTVQQFQDNLIPTLQKQGWWGTVTDPSLTGITDPVVIGPQRLRTIYDTNLRVSRAAGRWGRIQALKGERPFLRYSAVLDSRTRPAHRVWHGTILPVDHSWWDTHYPPCGWYCRCTVNQLSQRDLDRRGWKVTSVPPAGPPQKFLRPGTSVPIDVPAGISPGFAYNAGKASMAAIAEKATRTLERVAATNRAAALATLEDLVTSDIFLETLAEPGAAFPVMILDDTLRSAIGAQGRVAVLSSDTYAKQLGKTGRSAGHIDLTIDDYRMLPRLGADADVVAREGENVLKLVRLTDGQWLVAIVKRTADGAEMYVTSVRRQRDSSIASLLSGTTIIYDRRG